MSSKKLKPSPNAARGLIATLGDTMMSFSEVEDSQCETDCPHGCYVEPDGYCSHGWLSAARTAGVI